MEPVDIRMRLRKDEKCTARKAMELNPLISAGRLPSWPRETREELLLVSRRSSVKVGIS